MAKLRKMLGSPDSPEIIALMGLIETQSKETLARWAYHWAKEQYLPVYRKDYPVDIRLSEALATVEDCLENRRKWKDIKPVLKAAADASREAEGNPAAQAAARAISTACGVLQTPTNSLGFLFYGAAALAYSQAGTAESPEVYEELARKHFQDAFQSLEKVAVPHEPNPAKINWNC